MLVGTHRSNGNENTLILLGLRLYHEKAYN